MRKTTLKGGSLGITELIELNDKKFVRKSINCKKDREYGFIRWQSQLRKIQRLNSLNPGLFPRIIDVGVDGETYFYDMTFLEGYVDVKTYLSSNILKKSEVSELSNKVSESLEEIHRYSLPNIDSSPTLYFYEEVLSKIDDARKYTQFEKFYYKSDITFMGKKVRGFLEMEDRLLEYFSNSKLSRSCEIHGNTTLENIMYSPTKKKVIFIDPYEESILESSIHDYSMVRQCSLHLYGLLNDNFPNLTSNLRFLPSFSRDNFEIFDTRFLEGLNVDMRFLNILQACQFFRMLPFKCLGNQIEKSIFFYSYGCMILEKELF